jgi:hypothetical protein
MFEAEECLLNDAIDDGASDLALASSHVGGGCGGETPGKDGRGGNTPGGGGRGGKTKTGKEMQSVKPSAKQKGAVHGKGTRQTGKKCKGCDKWFDDQSFPPNSLFCALDKRALDAIARRAAVQGEEAKLYYRNAREDAAKVKQMLDIYWKSVGGREAYMENKKRKSAQFCMLQCMEVMRAEHQVKHTARHKLMTKQKWMVYARSEEGGRLGDEAASRKWQEYLDNDDIEKEMTEQGQGCYVPFEKILDVTNLVARGREMQTLEKASKKVDQEAIERNSKRPVPSSRACLAFKRSPPDSAGGALEHFLAPPLWPQ